ncbi:MAG: hypothetical protein ABIM89_00810 [Mycobacteriales bacterium]
MTDIPAEAQVELEMWDRADVVALVEDPLSFKEPEKSGDGSWERDPFTGLAAVLPGAAGLVVPLVLLALRAKSSAGQKASSEPHVVLMRYTDAVDLVKKDLLFFPSGGPRLNTVYARHPLRVRDYLPFAEYHRAVLNEKAIEAARYLLTLGARDVTIAWRDARGKEAKGDASIPLPDAADVSLQMGFGRDDDSGELSIRITGAGKARPRATDLIWPGNDPMFKLVRDAARAGAETFHFGLKAQQSNSVNGRAAVKIKGLGLGLGGDYKRWEDLTFTVDAAFAR